MHFAKVIGSCVVIATMGASLTGGPAPKVRKLVTTSRGQYHRLKIDQLGEPLARVVAEYEAMDVIAVPDSAFERIADRLSKTGYDVSELDEAIELPRRRLHRRSTSRRSHLSQLAYLSCNMPHPRRALGKKRCARQGQTLSRYFQGEQFSLPRPRNKPSSGVDSVGASTAGFNQKDSDSYGQFYYGLGVAPGVRIGSTKMKTTTAVGSTIAMWTTLAVSQDCNTPSTLCPNAEMSIDPTPNCVATVQNHSYNTYTAAVAGAYTIDSQEMDISVRNASRVTPPSTMKPLTLTISAGNYGATPGDPTRSVLPAATAKNVIAMGAAESTRTAIASCATDFAAGDNPTERHRAAGYNVVAYCSRRGTTDGRLKPDLTGHALVWSEDEGQQQFILRRRR